MPTAKERVDLCREHLLANVAERGEPHGVRCTRRHLSGYLWGLRGAADLRRRLNLCDSLAGCLEILEGAEHLDLVAPAPSTGGGSSAIVAA